MMLYKPFVALLMTFAAVGSIAASVTPVARSGGQCNTGSALCCVTLTNSSSPLVTQSLLDLLPANTQINPTLIVGLTCSVFSALNQW